MTRKEYQAQWHKANRERILKQNNEKYLLLHPKEFIPEGHKKCCTCHEIIKVDCFGKAASNKDGLKHACKACRKQNEYTSQIENITKIRAQHYKDNKEVILKNCKIYKATNKEKYQLYDVQYYKENKAHIKENVRAYRLERAQNDINFRLLCRYRTRIYKALKGICKQETRKLIGCSIEDLKTHLKKQFTAGMTWENYGEWHVDHIRPCSTYDFNNAEDQVECFNYKNLQPLWALDNLRKSDKF